VNGDALRQVSEHIGYFLRVVAINRIVEQHSRAVVCIRRMKQNGR